MSPEPFQIAEVRPLHAVPGGRIVITGEGFDPSRAHELQVFFGASRGQVTRVSSRRIGAVVPAEPDQAMVRVELDGRSTDPFPLSLARKIADELHPVANPVFDAEGNLLVTFSGARGEKVPVSVFQIDRHGKTRPFLSEILNPTGMAYGPDGCLYVSSRQEGTVYRVGPDREVEPVADELGVATGIAFDREGILYVGDRQGTIYRVERNGEPRAFCRLPPSVAAYHLAFGDDGALYVTGPSLATVDAVYRIDPSGRWEIFCSGFGRPQGLAFDADGYLYVTEALVGESGLYRIDAGGRRELLVAGPPLVGIAFDPNGGIALAGNTAVFRLDMAVYGRPLT